MKYWIFLFALIMVMGFASAVDNIGNYVQDNPANIILDCIYNGTYCGSSFNCNLTIKYNNYIIVNNEAMGETLMPQFNYTLSNTSLVGEYNSIQVCCLNGLCNEYNFNFDVTPSGTSLSLSEIFLYIFMALIILGVFAMALYFAITMDGKNKKNAMNEYIAINWNKYIKFGLYGLAYVSLIAIMFLFWNLSFAYSKLGTFANLFYGAFRFLVLMFIPALAILFIITLLRFLKDLNLEKRISRGLIDG